MLRGSILLSVACLATAAALAGSNKTWSQLWLNYAPVSQNFRAQLNYSTIQCKASSDLLKHACAELVVGLSSMLGRNVTAGSISAVGSSVVILVTGQHVEPIWPPSPALEGFNITVAIGGDTIVAARSAQGALYGAFRLLLYVARESQSLLSPGVVESSAPNVRDVALVLLKEAPHRYPPAPT